MIKQKNYEKSKKEPHITDSSRPFSNYIDLDPMLSRESTSNYDL